MGPNGYNGGLVIVQVRCGIDGSNRTVDNFFCNVHFFRVPRTWTGRVQMKSNMTFIRGNMCIERKIILKAVKYNV